MFKANSDIKTDHDKICNSRGDGVGRVVIDGVGVMVEVGWQRIRIKMGFVNLKNIKKKFVVCLLTGGR